MIEAIVVALVACAALYYVTAPLRSRVVGDGHATPELSDFADATAKKEAALEGIVDAENERALGKLSQADFEVLLRLYEAEALAALRELDMLQHQRHRAERELEAEIAAARDRLACPSCGAPRKPGEACPACGG